VVSKNLVAFGGGGDLMLWNSSVARSIRPAPPLRSQLGQLGSDRDAWTGCPGRRLCKALGSCRTPLFLQLADSRFDTQDKSHLDKRSLVSATASAGIAAPWRRGGMSTVQAPIESLGRPFSAGLGCALPLQSQTRYHDSSVGVLRQAARISSHAESHIGDTQPVVIQCK
jgi:hypothetical protein